jgi:hypothetical protein
LVKADQGPSTPSAAPCLHRYVAMTMNAAFKTEKYKKEDVVAVSAMEAIGEQKRVQVACACCCACVGRLPCASAYACAAMMSREGGGCVTRCACEAGAIGLGALTLCPQRFWALVVSALPAA